MKNIEHDNGNTGHEGERLLTLEEVQSRELRMFKLFDGFCREHGLRYYMCGGTLLGAVRHGGFIPWDDDIDLMMPRPDYDRMQEFMKEQPFMPEHEFHSLQLGNLRENFTKLVDTRTEVDKQYVYDEYDVNLWIDIFPMDGLPEDDAEVEKIYKAVARKRKLLKFLKAKPGTGRNAFKKVIKPIIKPVVELFTSKEKLLNDIERIARRYPFDESKYAGSIAYAYGPQERMIREDYVKQIEMQFEDLMAFAPEDYDTYLKAIFGDYMTLPPEDKRQVHFMDIYGW